MQIDYQDRRHQRIVEFVGDCFKLSEDVVSQRYNGWEKADKMDSSFVDVAETDEKGRKKNPFERQVYIPHSRACKDTIKTYWLNVIAGKKPIIRLHGRGPEDVRPAKLNEIVMDYQAEYQRLILTIDTFLNDILKYGVGSIKDTYGRQWQTGYRQAQRIEMFPFPHMVSQQEEYRYLEYEGPMFSNNDPYMWFPDPRYSQADAALGQFVGFEYERSHYHLKKLEAEGVYFNIDVLNRVSIGDDNEENTVRTERNRIRGITSNTPSLGKFNKNPQRRLHELWVEIIPSDLGVAESNYPQEWVFTVADDTVLIRAERNGMAHGGKPEVRAEYDRDGYSTFNPGYYENAEGLQDLLNFLYNSHIDNVRGYLNNMMVVDPKAVEMADVLRPGPRRLIRLKKSLYNEKNANINQVLQQLHMGDVTSSHIKDASMIMDTMQRQSHTPDSLQGIETEIKRTATEIAKVSSSGASHLGMDAILVYAQSMVPLGRHWVANNHKFMTEERYYRIAGDYAKELARYDQSFRGKEETRIGPAELQGVFDFPIDDGRMPVRPEENAQVWAKILETVAKTPPLQQQIEVFAVFKELARSLGVKNVDDFKVQAHVVPDEQIERMNQAGDVIPINQFIAGRPGADLPMPARGAM